MSRANARPPKPTGDPENTGIRRLLDASLDTRALLEGFASANQLIYYGLSRLLELREDPALGSVVQPPLWSDTQHHVYFGLAHSASHCVIFWSIVATVAHDIFCGRGNIDLSMYPTDVVQSGIAEDAMAAVFRHYDFSGSL